MLYIQTFLRNNWILSSMQIIPYLRVCIYSLRLCYLYKIVSVLWIKDTLKIFSCSYWIIQNQSIIENVLNFTDEARFYDKVLHKRMKIIYFILKHGNTVRNDFFSLLWYDIVILPMCDYNGYVKEFFFIIIWTGSKLLFPVLTVKDLRPHRFNST